MRNVETYLMKNLHGKCALLKWARTHSQVTSLLLEHSVATQYMKLIHILQWMCELAGRLTIALRSPCFPDLL